jgi:hypothetical protein
MRLPTTSFAAIACLATLAPWAALRAQSHDGGMHRWGGGIHQAIVGYLFGDATEEEKAALKEIGRQFVAGAKAKVPALHEKAKAFLSTVKATLTEEQVAAVKGLVQTGRSMEPREKMRLGMRLLRSLNTPELRKEAATWLTTKGADRAAAGETIAKAAAAKVVAFIGGKAGVGADQQATVLAAFDDLLAQTKADRAALQALAEEKYEEALKAMTEAQRGRIEAAKAFAIGWLAAAQ